MNAPANISDLSAHMQGVARILLGEPNARMSSKRELRFGANGSWSIDLEKGTAFSHEMNQGGGVLWLIEQLNGAKGKDAFAWLKSNGFEIEDRPPRLNGHASHDERWPKREIEKTYDYVDASGTLAFQVVRQVFRNADGSYEKQKNGKNKKTFMQRRKAPDGTWINGIRAGEYMRKGPGKDWREYDAEKFTAWKYTERTTFEAAPAVIYRLPEVIEAIAFGSTVYIVEGEKKADLLWDWGVPATCNAGGAKKWRGEFAAFFRDADVVILPDADEPARAKDGALLFNPDGSPRIAGRDHADQVAESLKGAAKRVRGLDLPGLGPKEDVVDWAAKGGTVEQLIQLTESLARPWQKQPFVSKFGAVAFENIDEPGPEHEFMIDDWFTVGDKSVIGGPSRSGKSFLAIHAGMAIALASLPQCSKSAPDFFANKVLTPGLVIYQAGEGARGVKQRLRAFRKHFGIPSVTRVPFVLLQSKIDLYSAQGDTAGLIDEVKGLAAGYDVPLRALFIDTLATATGGADENSGRDMSTVMANIDRIAAACPGCHVSLVHHMNAAGTKLRGHTSVYANVDQVITVNRDEITKIRTAVLDKQKDGEDGKKIRFKLKSVELGIRPRDGKVLTSCVCVTVDDREFEAQTTGFRLKGQEELIFKALMKALETKGRPAPVEMAAIPADTTVVEYKHWRALYAASAPIDSEDERTRSSTIKKAMQRAGATLLRYDVIGREQNFVWWTGKAVRGITPRPKPQKAPQAQSSLMTMEDLDAFAPF
ncbi:MAG TPA: AAA family ATPase [Pseudolabrys sp.]|nr:AAA family ATPase [Pseudolabrys sp.]